jgi:hypothetical protein
MAALSLHPLEYPMTAAVLSSTVKRTSCITSTRNYFSFLNKAATISHTLNPTLLKSTCIGMEVTVHAFIASALDIGK